MCIPFWPISQCWKSGQWSRPSPERLLWEGKSISSVPIYTVPALIERQNEARPSRQSGQKSEGFGGKTSHCAMIPAAQNPLNQCNAHSSVLEYWLTAGVVVTRLTWALNRYTMLSTAQDEQSTGEHVQIMLLILCLSDSDVQNLCATEWIRSQTRVI